MKPLLLSLEGLQSYRDRQQIDFSQMNGCGLFGIFGPTGSGKSTLLDAMTLALYGIVNRASHNTQGIINSASDSLTVSFTFALQQGPLEQGYRVERIYRRKRQQPDSCEARVGRLIRLDGRGDTVLADKPGEVTEAVEHLIGLHYTDFIRAVVLPQNQFQEFLLLGKKDKSDMLERLFCLEAYGRDLSSKTARSRRICEDEMRTAAGALDILADSADEAVEALAGMAAAASAERLRIRTLHDQEKQQIEDERVRYRLTCQKNQVLEQERQLARQKAEREKDRRRLHLARQIEPIWPIWQETQRLQSRERSLDQELAGLMPALAAARRLLAENRQALQACQEEVARSRDELIRQAGFLEKAAGLAGQHERLATDLAAASLLENQLLGQAAEMDQKAAGLQGKVLDLQKRLAEQREVRQGLRVDPVWRQALENWLHLQNQIDANRQSLQAAQAERELLTRACQDKAAIFARIGGLHSQEEDQLFRRAATHLRPGEPCPVCGSCAHPAPADACAGDQALPSEQERVRCQRDMIQAEEQLAANRQKLAGLHDSLAALTGAAAVQIQRQPALRQQENGREQLDDLYAREVHINELDHLLLQLDQEMLERRQAWQSLQDQLGQVKNRLAGQSSRRQALEGQITALAAELAACLPDWPPEQIRLPAIKQAAAAVKNKNAILEDRLRSLLEQNQSRISGVQALEQREIACRNRRDDNAEYLLQTTNRLDQALIQAGLADPAAMAGARLDPDEMALTDRQLQAYERACLDVELNLLNLDKQIGGREIDEQTWLNRQAAYQARSEQLEQAVSQDELLRHRLQELSERRTRRLAIKADFDAAAARRERISQIEGLIRGNAFVEFVAEERLRLIAAEATGFLQTMSRGRFALELDQDTAFVVRDQMNGGTVRAAASLSGGETFMASLALALALSAQIQIRGQSRLAFFFLDEGFGSLDGDLLEQVMDALERVSRSDRLIGLISHVQDLRQRVPVRLIIEAPDGLKGSWIRLERS